jgi:putative DNA primase/helicase
MSTSSQQEYEVPAGLPDIVSRGIRLWGEPTKRTPGKVIFGAHGSKCVQPAPTNTWFDHEANVGGGYFDLYKLNYGKLPDPPGFPIPPGMAKELGDPVAWWDYHNAASQPFARVARFHPPGADKTYRQFRWEGGRWRAGMKRLELPLYHLPELLKAPAGSTVYIAEGEKCVDQIRAWGLLATTNAGGAQKFRPDHAAGLARFDCVILPDNDEAGRKHADVVASALRAAGCNSIRVLNLPNLPPKGDVIDWVRAGGTSAEFAELVTNAPAYQATKPETKDEEPDPQRPAPDDPRPHPKSKRKTKRTTNLNGFDLTEDGIALAFAAQHQDLLRYDHSIGKWFQWTGKAWRQDETKLAFSWSRRTCRQLAKEAEYTSLPKANSPPGPVTTGGFFAPGAPGAAAGLRGL